jgi:flavin-dependent dehydrogenase
MEKHEVVIVGAGPGGLKAAQTLMKYGKKDVVVLEALPEEKMGDKTCHGMMFPNNMAILDIPEELTETPLNGAVFYWADRTYTELNFDPPACYMWLRKDFGRWLIEETKKLGVDIRPDSRVKQVNKEENYVELGDNERIGYDYLIGADGAKSVVRKTLGLKTKSVMATYVEAPIPPDKVPNGKSDFAHGYMAFDVVGHGWSGYTPYKDRISFCLVSCDSKFFSNNEKIERFNAFAKEVDGIDPGEYKLRAQAVCYKPVGLKHGNIYLVGDAGGWGDIGGGIIYSAAKTGKMAAEDICGIDIKGEFKDFNSWNRRWQLPGNIITLYDAIVPDGIKKRTSRFLIDVVLPALAKNNLVRNFLWPYAYKLFMKVMFDPLPGDDEDGKT